MGYLQDTFPKARRFLFTSPSFPEDTFAVVSFEGHEAVSRPYRFEIDLVSEDAEIDGLINQDATFTVRGLEGGDKEVVYHGIVAEFEQSRRVRDLAFYRVVLMPRFSRLMSTRISEVYLNEQTLPDIIVRVLQEGGLTALDFRKDITGKDYRQRSFVCQFEETYFDFISRLMERDGIYYYFKQDDTREVLVITDSASTHPPSASSFFYREKAMMDDATFESVIQTLVMKQKVIPAKVTLKEYNYRRSTQDLTATADVSRNGTGEVVIYGENYRSVEEGHAMAKIRAEEILCREKVFEGESSAIGLVSGHFMTLKDHFRDSFNRDYLVLEVSHEGAQAAAFLAGLDTAGPSAQEDYYRNRFALIPSSVQFRPERVTPKPKIHGAMSAFIDAEGSGQYAEINEYGQYKVQLPFDKTDKPDAHASAWVRMATPYAGSDHGMHFPLLKGTEVLLTFIDGDPDQPVISGAVPNSTNPSVVKDQNLQMNVLRTAGGNQLVLGDDRNEQFIGLWSPFHQSGIAIGSTEPGGGGSLGFTTKGNVHTVAAGNMFSIAMGGKTNLTLGSQGAVNVGVNSTVNVALNSTFNLFGDSISFNTAASHSYALGWGKSYNLKPTAAFGAVRGITLCGGMQEPYRALWWQLGFALVIALGGTVSGVVGAEFCGSLFDDNWKYVGDKYKLASSVLGFVGQGIAFVAVEALLRGFAQRGFDNALSQGRINGVIKCNTAGVQVSSFGDNSTIELNAPGIGVLGGAPLPRPDYSSVGIGRTRLGMTSCGAAGMAAHTMTPNQILMSCSGAATTCSMKLEAGKLGLYGAFPSGALEAANIAVVTAEDALSMAEDALSVAESERDLADEDERDEQPVLRAQEALNRARQTRDEALATQQQAAAALAPNIQLDGNAVQIQGKGNLAGFVAGPTKIGIKYQGAQITADAGTLTAAFGDAQIRFSPIGINGEGQLIKLA